MLNLKRILSIFISYLLIIQPVTGYADSMMDSGLDAQQFGKEMINNLSTGGYGYNNGQITLPTMDPKTGEFNNNETTTIDVNDLFPGTSTKSDTPMTDYFPDTLNPSVGGLESISNNSDDMDDMGKLYQYELFKNANSNSPTTTGSAYKVLMDRANQPIADLSNDPVLDLTKDVYANIDTISKEFADCSTETTLSNISNTEHIPDYKNCERMRDQSQICTVNHLYDASVIEHHSGPYNILPIEGKNSINIWIGTVGNNYWSGSCKIFEEVTEYRVSNPAAIQKVTLTRAKWDDYIQIYVGPPGQETMVWDAPSPGIFPPETAGKCELSTSWDQNPNLDITSEFMNNIDQDDIVRFKIRVSVTGSGEGYAKLQIDYDPELAIIQDEWVPQNCIDAAKGMYDDFAKGTVTCTSIPGDIIDGCTTIGGIRVCENKLAPSPFPAIEGMFDAVPALCNQAEVNVDYNFYDGQFCWINSQGFETCAEGGMFDETCKALENNPQCGYISSQCVEGARADDGTCYVTEETWDCGTDVEIEDINLTQTFDCVGPVRCMGSDCLNPEDPESSSFAETAAMLNAAQFMTQDMNCTPVDGNNDVTCQVFGGVPLTCKKAIGGLIDCCDVPTAVTLANYISTLMGLAKMDSALMAIQGGNAMVGAYQSMHYSISSATQPFTSYIENISGEVTEFFEPVTTYMENLATEIEQSISDAIGDLIGDTASNMGTQAAESVAADQATAQAEAAATDSIMATMSSAASAVMTVYAYYVIAVMVLEIIYECEDSEFELAAKKDLKACNKVGSYCSQTTGPFGRICLEKKTSYCCYNSPLSRIISEQVRPQLRPYGSVKNPDCGGMDISEVTKIDWSQVDLGEWVAILKLSDLSPNIGSMNIETLTGAGSNLNNINGTRVNAADRATQRLNGLDIDQIRLDLNNQTVVDPKGYIPPTSPGSPEKWSNDGFYIGPGNAAGQVYTTNGNPSPFIGLGDVDILGCGQNLCHFRVGDIKNTCGTSSGGLPREVLYCHVN